MPEANTHLHAAHRLRRHLLWHVGDSSARKAYMKLPNALILPLPGILRTKPNYTALKREGKRARRAQRAEANPHNKLTYTSLAVAGFVAP